MSPRWRNALTRKRGRPGRWKAVSSSPVLSKVARRLGALEPTSRRTSSSSVGSSVGQPASGSSVAVEADDRRLADLEVDVARAAVDDAEKQAVQIHGDSMR